MKQFSAADEAQIRVLKEALSTLDKRLAALENSIHNIDYAVRTLPERSRAEPWVLLATFRRKIRLVGFDQVGVACDGSFGAVGYWVGGSGKKSGMSQRRRGIRTVSEMGLSPKREGHGRC